MVICWIMLGIYILLMTVIGILGARKTSSMSDFVVGGRKAGPWVSAFAYGTAYFSAVVFIGYAGRSGWGYGLWAALIGVGNAIFGGYLAWKVLAKRTRRATQRLEIKSMPQLFEKRYGSRAMKIFAAIVIFFFMTPYSASVYTGLSYLGEIVLEVDYHLIMVIIAVVAAIYLVLGGYIAALSADFVQGIIMIVGVIAMIIVIIFSPEVGGFSEGFAKMGELMQTEGIADFTAPGTSVLGLISLIFLTSFATWGLPQMVHKYYAIKDDAAIRRGTIISTVFCLIISGGAYFLGSFSRLFDGILTEKGVIVDGVMTNTDQIIPTILAERLPVLLLGIVLILVLSASVSTLSSLTLTSCSTVTMDLVAGALRPNIKPKSNLLLTRILCLVFIVISFLIASFKGPILTLMSFSWGSVAGSFLAPYLLGLFWKRMNRAGAWAGMIGGLGTELILAVGSGFDTANSNLFGMIAILVSFILCIVVSFVVKCNNGEDSEAFFAKDEKDEVPVNDIQ
ncbi:MAG: sodium:solute symporter family protein [Oscillospiraceae bacterium]|nr:sodium:solute symporter family protein [Oscillospiraceae bacterium]MBQ8732682.1 sodium:solute symporter family protein [Oscillospiraceae bacterium]